MNEEQKQALYLKIVKAAKDYGKACSDRGACGNDELSNGVLWMHESICWGELVNLVSEAVYGKENE